MAFVSASVDHRAMLFLAQVHGFPRVMGVLTHLDGFKEQAHLKKAKKSLKVKKRGACIIASHRLTQALHVCWFCSCGAYECNFSRV